MRKSGKVLSSNVYFYIKIIFLRDKSNLKMNKLKFFSEPILDNFFHICNKNALLSCSKELSDEPQSSGLCITQALVF